MYRQTFRGSAFPDEIARYRSLVRERAAHRANVRRWNATRVPGHAAPNSVLAEATECVRIERQIRALFGKVYSRALGY